MPRTAGVRGDRCDSRRQCELAVARAAGVDANILLPAPLAELLAHVYALIGPPSPHNESGTGVPDDHA